MLHSVVEISSQFTQHASTAGKETGIMTKSSSESTQQSSEEIASSVQAASAHISVSAFREILLWPFVLKEQESAANGPQTDFAKCMADIARAAAGEGWQPVRDLTEHIPRNDERAQSWGEIVYFHDFVQRVLFHKTQGEWPEQDAPMWLLRNEQLCGLQVDIIKEDRAHHLCFAVQRCNLYLFPTGVAILAMEVVLEDTEQDPTRLDQALDFMDFFRRWHVPYWAKGKPGLMPARVVWRWRNGEDHSFDIADPGLKKSHRQLLTTEWRSPHPVPHWLEILPAIIRAHLVSTPPDQRANHACMRHLCWRSISDERMITSNFVIVPDIGAISEADWVRLCFADQAGDSASWPYRIHDADWQTFHREHVFDWFHDAGTRQLFAGFNHAIVCSGGPFPSNTLVHHFRRHYFHMALLAQFEFTTLLAFSSRITHAVKRLRSTNNEDSFREEFFFIRRSFLHFVHEFRFTGISNQMQPREMFRLWRKHLGLDALFRDVEDELRTGNDYLLAIENRERTETAGRLNIIVAILGLLGLVMAYATSDKSSFDTVQRLLFGKGAHEWLATFAMTSLGVLSLSLLLAPLFLSKENERNSLRPIGQYFGYTMAALACLAVLGLLF